VTTHERQFFIYELPIQLNSTLRNLRALHSSSRVIKRREKFAESAPVGEIMRKFLTSFKYRKHRNFAQTQCQLFSFTTLRHQFKKINRLNASNALAHRRKLF
jgi:hypothetical protein